MRHPRAEFAAGCDVRPGLHLVMGPAAVVRFGPDCVLDRGLTVEVFGTLEVGAGTIFGHHCTLGVKERVIIGPDCLIADMVAIRDNDHVFERPDVPYRLQGHTTAPVVLGRNVWLGSRVVVARGVTIGDGAVVGAGSVVTKDVPARTVVAGVPARLLREL